MMKMRWFGEPWGRGTATGPDRAPVCSDDEMRIPTPIGVACGSEACDEVIERRDRGVATGFIGGELEVGKTFLIDGQVAIPYHLDCFLRMIVPFAADVVTRQP